MTNKTTQTNTHSTQKQINCHKHLKNRCPTSKGNHTKQKPLPGTYSRIFIHVFILFVILCTHLLYIPGKCNVPRCRRPSIHISLPQIRPPTPPHAGGNCHFLYIFCCLHLWHILVHPWYMF